VAFVRCFKYGSLDERDLAVLAENGVTAENHHRILNAVNGNIAEIAELESALPDLRRELRETVDTLDALEKVMGATWVQSLIDEEKSRTQSDYVPNGVINADTEQVSFGSGRKK
jgi:hypothetical protein